MNPFSSRVDVLTQLDEGKAAEIQTQVANLGEGWRVEQLRRAGYPARAASKLAKHRDVDLHLAIELLDRGCRPALAIQILL